MKTYCLAFLTLLGCAMTLSPTHAALPHDDAAPGGAVPNRFGLKLFDTLRASPGNLFFSPFSIAAALSMTAAGATGETQSEMRDVLGQADPDTADPAFDRLLTALAQASNDDGPLLRIANGIWPQAGETLHPAFRETVVSRYRAAIEPLHYRHDPEAARRTINAWVARQTADRIPELMGDGSVSPMTRMVLANAIYFKGNWQAPFNPAMTREAPFHISPTHSVTTPLMFQESRFPYAEDDTAQWIELPFTGDQLTLVALLPRTADGLPALEAQLTPDRLAQWHAALQPQNVQILLPRFRIDWRATLNRELQTLGMRRAFDPAHADFSGMRETRDDLHIDLVVHQAFVEVDETGAEAAAATGVGMRVTSVAPPAPLFQADRPFLFWIRHVPTDTLLFLGRLAVPPEPSRP